MKRILTFMLAFVTIGMIVTGCGKKDEFADKAPPAGDDARPDPANPHKLARLPGPTSPVGK
ncbi:MAG: hypothetical protein ABJA67_16610 [Chthonomonadales bacterium]